MTASFTARTLSLACHPATRCESARGIQVRVCWTENGDLAFNYVLRGDLSRLRIPAQREPRRAEGLWRHTCFEAFVAVKDKAEYFEFNFAPSGEWAVYALAGYREPSPSIDEAAAPTIDVRMTGDALELDAIVALPHLPMINPRARVRLALSAVIEDERGTLSYWALKHPAGKPDFHHPDSFALEVEPPAVVT